ncbi:hypothetical protein HDU88_008943 [Geranomyces variabilis]|nr:hypothetical protein HDU88_008943 [Geranomyces variabilis]
MIYSEIRVSSQHRETAARVEEAVPSKNLLAKQPAHYPIASNNASNRTTSALMSSSTHPYPKGIVPRTCLVSAVKKSKFGERLTAMLMMSKEKKAIKNDDIFGD